MCVCTLACVDVHVSVDMARQGLGRRLLWKVNDLMIRRSHGKVIL